MDVATPYLRHFHVLFDVASCLLNLSNFQTKASFTLPEIRVRLTLDKSLPLHARKGEIYRTVRICDYAIAHPD